jgi:hypothetical protein
MDYMEAVEEEEAILRETAAVVGILALSKAIRLTVHVSQFTAHGSRTYLFRHILT